MNPALAATVKVLKTVTGLRFATWRQLVMEPHADWMAKSKLTPTDKRQLIAILADYGTKPPITLERAQGTAPADLFTGGLDGFAERPVEWIDVFDQANVVQFQLWLYHGDAGMLFKASTTTPVAQVDHSSFSGDQRGLDETTSERLAALLRKAHKTAAKLYPDSQLASVAF